MEYGGEQMAPLSLSCIPLKFLKSDFVFIYHLPTYFSSPWAVATNDAESCGWHKTMTLISDWSEVITHLELHQEGPNL